MMKKEMYEFWLASMTHLSSKQKLELRGDGWTAEALYNIEETGQNRISEAVRERILESRREKDWAETYERWIAQGVRVVTAFDPAYPDALKNIQAMPYALFYKGKLCFSEDALRIGIVGARRCSPYGEQMTLKFAEALAGQKIQIISGMARGIDGIAHRGALNVGGMTCAVLGCGVDVCYPGEYRGLYQDIEAQGCLLSEYPPGTPPYAQNFPARNRIISGLSDVLLVMEAKEKSGSLITADLALEQGKEVYALPGNIENTLSAGCNRLIYQGAGILLGIEAFCEDLQNNRKFSDKIRVIEETAEKKVLETEEKLVYSCLGLYPKNREDLLKETKLMPEQLIRVLVALELKGYIEERSKNYYVRRK